MAGTIKEAGEITLTLNTTTYQTLRIDRDIIEERSATTSAMPDLREVLSLRKSREQVEYLAALPPYPQTSQE